MTQSSKIQIHGLSPEVSPRQSRRLVRQGPRPLALEQRFMFDGAALSDATQTLDTGSRTVETTAATSERSTASTATVQDMLAPAERETGVVRAVAGAREILFIDSGVRDIDALIAGTREGVEIVVLDAGSDPWQQMTDVIAQHQDLTAVHLVSHGEAGELILGGKTYAAADLQAEAAALAVWQAYLADDADILLYGCNVAAGADGMLLIDSLARLTRADVAASTDLTGAASQGGDWTLEQRTGSIETDLFAAMASLGAYNELLAVVPLGFATGSDTGIAGDNTTNLARPSLTFTPLTAAGSYVLTIDGTTQTAVAAAIAANTAFIFQLPSDLSDGSHTIAFETWSNGAGGGTSRDTGSYTFTVDRSAPTPTVATSSISTAQSVNVRSTEPGTAYLVNSTVVVTSEASITGAAGTSWNSVSITAANTDTALSASGLVAGSYKVYTVDAAGNLSAASTNTVTVSAPDSTAPDTTLTSQPSSLSNSTSATFSWSGTDNVAVTGYDYRLDGGSWTATTGTGVTLTGLTQGSHTFDVRAKDAQANVDGTPASYTWTVDTAAPTISVSSSKTTLGAGESATITFTLSETSTDFTISDVTVSGGTLGNFSGSGSSYTAIFTPDADSTANGVISVASASFSDAAGNSNSDGADANNTVTLAVDTSAPGAPTITAVTDNVGTITGTVAGGGVSDDTVLVLTGTAEANSTVTLYNGVNLLGTTTADSNGAWSYTTGTLSNGMTYAFNAKATDAAGNTGNASASYSVTIDTSAPATTVSTLAFSADTGSTGDFITSTSTQTISGTLSTNLSAGESVQVSLDNGSTWQAATALVGSTTFNLAGLTLAGSNTLQVRVVDAAGNAGSVRSQAYVLDVTAPGTTLSTQPAAVVKTGAASFSWSGSDGVGLAGYEYRVDGGSWTATSTTSVSLSALGAGRHTFEVRAIDTAGNVDATPETYSWTVDPLLREPGLAAANTEFGVLLQGTPFDPVNDTQSNAADTDLVGDASNPLLLGAYDSANDVMYFRIRIGDPTMVKVGTTYVPRFTGVALIGLDVNNDGRLDLMLGVDGRNSGLGVVLYDPGTGANDRPSTTSITNQTAAWSVNDLTLAYDTVNKASSTATYRYEQIKVSPTDVGASDGQDAYLTFKVPFSVLVQRLATTGGGRSGGITLDTDGQPINESSAFRFALFTMTQNNSINGDVGGIGKSNTDYNKPWSEISTTLSFTKPTVLGVSGTIAYSENQGTASDQAGLPKALAPTATLADLDTSNFSGSTLVLGFDAASWHSGDALTVLDGTNGVTLDGANLLYTGSVIGSYNWDASAHTLTISFNASGVPADAVQAVLRSVAYRNTSENPDASTRTIAFNFTDPDGYRSPATAVTVAFTAINDAPVVSQSGNLNRVVQNSVSYDDSSVAATLFSPGVDSGIVIADVDASTRTVEARLSVDKGVLDLYDSTLVSGAVATTFDFTAGGQSYRVEVLGAGTSTLILHGSVDAINAFLAGHSDAGVVYQPGSIPGEGAQSAALTLTVHDLGNSGTGGNLSATRTVGTITIEGTPLLLGTFKGSVREDDTAGSQLATGNTITVAAGSALGLVPDSAISYQGNSLGTPALGTLTVDASGRWTYTVSNSEVAIQALASGQSIVETYRLQGTVTDAQDQTSAAIGYIEITIGGVNDAPVLSATGGSRSYTENAALGTVLFTGASAVFGAGETGQSFTRLTLTVDHVVDGDRLVVDGSTLAIDAASSGTLTTGGYTVDVALDGQGVATLTIRNSGASAVQLQGMVESLRFFSVSENPTALNSADVRDTRVVTLVSLTDSGGTSNGGADTGTFLLQATVDLTALNDAPGGTDAVLNLVKNGTRVLGISDFGYSDPEGDVFTSVQITALASAGALQYNRGTALAPNWVDVSLDQLITAADIGAGKLRYQPAADASGQAYASFDFKVSDGSTPSASANTITFNVIDNNTAPTTQDGRITANEDTPRVLDASAFYFGDVDGDVLDSVIITATGGNGSFEYRNGAGQWVAVGVEQTVTAAELAAGRLRFVPQDNGYGEDYATLTFKVSDGDKISETAMLTLDVAPVNDAPSGTDHMVNAHLGAPYTLIESDFGFSDLDGADLLAIKFTQLESYAKGGLQVFDTTGRETLLDGVTGSWRALVEGESVSSVDIMAGRLRFGFTDTSDLANFTYTYSFQVQDNGGTANGGVDLDPVANTGSLHFDAYTPAITVPVEQFIREDGTFVFTGDTAITIAHTQAPGIPKEQLRVLVDFSATVGGTLTLANDPPAGVSRENESEDGTSFDYVWNSDAHVVSVVLNANGSIGLTGFDDDISAVLAGLTFRPAANDYSADADGTVVEGRSVSAGNHAYATVRVSATAIHVYNVAEPYDHDTGVASVDIVVKAVNDAPTLSATGGARSYTEDTAAATPLFTGATVSTVEAGQLLNQLTLTVAGLADGEQERLSVSGSEFALVQGSSGTITLPGDKLLTYSTTVSGTTATVTLERSAGLSTSELKTLVESLAYRVSGDDPTGGDRTITVTGLRDNGGTALEGQDTATLSLTAILTVQAVNDAPSARNLEVPLNLDTPYVFSVEDFGFTDTADGNDLLAVHISTLPATGQLQYLDENDVWVDVVLDAESRTWRILASDIEAGSLRYLAPASDPATDPRFDFRTQDDGGTDNEGVDTATEDHTVTLSIVPLTVSSPRVNEASDYVVFEITGITGQEVTLALREGDTTVAGNADIANGQTLQVWSGSDWVSYSNNVVIPTGGKLLVRVDISDEHDARYEGAETFALRVTNTGGVSRDGTASIVDDGTGSTYDGSLTDGSPVAGSSDLDNDLAVSVTAQGPVNEGSTYAFFTVDATPGQALTLALGNTASEADRDASIGSFSFEYSTNGTSWTSYSWNGESGNRPTVPEGGKVYVRVAIGSEADGTYEGAETFTLTAATATGAGRNGSATTSIVDDGTGSTYDGTVTDGSPVAGSSGLDNDLAVSVTAAGPVNEASPYAFFTIDATPGQALTLALGNTAGETDRDASIGSFSFEYSTNGTSWTSYSWSGESGNRPTVPEGGKVYVRVAIDTEADGTYEGAETFTLVANLATGAGKSASATATIKDDGTGAKYDGTVDETREPVASDSGLDNDLAVSVTAQGPVNEASPYAFFTVQATPGQALTLALGNTASEVDRDASTGGFTLQYSNDGTHWTTYSWNGESGNRPTVPDGGNVYVRVAIDTEADGTYEGAETFTLTAATATGAGRNGSATTSIVDDGTGSKYDGSVTDGTPVAGSSGLDNDLAVSVTAQGPVNEGSTYAFFTVDATPGQALTLVLGNTASDADRDASTGSFTFEYSTNGTSWTTYSWNGESGNRPTVPEGGKVYVRVNITSEADGSYEGAETFTLNASTDTGAGRSASATASIVDDGTGAKYGPDAVDGSPKQSGSGLDDDRTLRVSSFTVNEASPYAVFRVNTSAGAQLTLALSSGPAGSGSGAAAETTDYSSNLQYFNGSTWLNYDPTTPVLVPTGSTLLLVRTAVVNDGVYEGPEVFTLTATQVNGASTLSASGQATIRDDGTGVIFNASGSESPNAVRDDDRALQVSSLEVNEGSPYAVFTVTGTPGADVTLSMSDGSATGSGTDYGAGFKVSLDGGTSWTDYAGPLAMPTGGAMLVRTAILNDDGREGPETFTLRAVQGGLDVTGTGTIKDDGTGKVFNADGSENTAAIKDDDFDKDGIAPNVEEILASMAASVGSGSALPGDLNGDGLADAEQNALATLAWTTVDRFNQALDGTLTEVTPIISLSAVDVATGETVSPTQQLENVKVLAPTDALIGGSKPTGANLEVLWDPIQFALTSKDPATGLADIDLTRPGTQVRVLIDISRSNLSEGFFNGYMKYVSADTLAAYGGTLTGLDGQAITTAGWYDFMQRTPGGDGARYIVEGGRITAIELIITDNKFGDNDITAGRVFDPGVPVYRTATVTARTEVPPLPGAAPVLVAPQVQREPQLAEAALPRAARPFDTALHSLQMPVAMQALRLTEPTTDRTQLTSRGEINLEQQAWRDVYSGQSAWRTLIVEGEGERLLPFRGMTDQYARFGSQGKFSVPWDAFAHTKPDAIVLLVAKLADGSDLPAWIQLGRRTGIFSYQAPAGFQGELEIELMARDTEGREATTRFKLTIGELPAQPTGRAGLSEQLRMAAQRPALWHELSRAQGGKLEVDKFPPAANRPVLHKTSAG